jgi:hypothetical protein
MDAEAANENGEVEKWSLDAHNSTTPSLLRL